MNPMLHLSQGQRPPGQRQSCNPFQLIRATALRTAQHGPSLDGIGRRGDKASRRAMAATATVLFGSFWGGC